MYDVHIFSDTTLASTTNILYIYYPSKFEYSFLHSKESTHCYIYIIIEEPRSCLIIARNRLGRAMLLLDLAESFPRRNINPGIPPALSQPRSCCHTARCIKTQFSWKQNAPWSLGEALGMVRILMPGELKCLPFEMSSCQSKYL